MLARIFSVAFSGYEVLNEPIWNWTSAAVKFTEEDNLLARITSIEELCKAQAEAQRSFNYGYWTALKRNSMGAYHWGRLANNSANVTEELLERSQPVDRCYVINKSAMKLLSRDCDSLQGVLLSFTDYKDGKQILTLKFKIFKNNSIFSSPYPGPSLPSSLFSSTLL